MLMTLQQLLWPMNLHVDPAEAWDLLKNIPQIEQNFNVVSKIGEGKEKVLDC